MSEFDNSSNSDSDKSPGLPIYSILDLDAFEHGPEVQQFLDPTYENEDNSTIPSDTEDETSLDLAGYMSDSSDGSSCGSECTHDHAHWRTRSAHSSKSPKRPLSESVTAAKIPTFERVAPVSRGVTPPKVFKALHRSTRDIKDFEITAIEFYTDLPLYSVHLSRKLPPKAHVDGGALATTCDRIEYIFCYREFTAEERKKVPRLRVADDTIHIPTGEGYLKVPCRTEPGYMFIHTYFTPEIPATILSPHAACKAFACAGYLTYSDIVNNKATLRLSDCVVCDTSVDFDLRLHAGLLFTDSLFAPTPSEREATELPPNPICDSCRISDVDDDNVLNMNALTREQNRMLWHMRLGHSNHRIVADLHKYADGVPNLPRADVLDDCPICKQSKLHKAARGPDDDYEPRDCWQDVQIDFGFIVQKSKAKKPSKASTRTKRVSKKAKLAKRLENSRKIRALREEQELRRSTRSGRFQGSFSQAAQRKRTSTSDAPLVETVDEDTDSVLESQTPPQQASSHKKSSPLPAPADSQLYTFEKIMTHEGPLSRDHKRFKGSRFNLKILWSTKQTTWEPMENIFETAPDDVIDYARKHNLLGHPDWSAVRDLALDDTRDVPPPTMADFDEEFESPEYETVTPSVTPTIPEEVSERYKRLLGVNGESCYVLITDRKSGAIKLSIRRDKSPPLDFFKSFIANYKPSVEKCRVRFDGGGELGNCKEVHDLFTDAGYEVEVTPPDTSSAIGQAERPHRTIADAIRTMLFAAGLPLMYWPYALKYHVLIHNMIPHAGREKSPFEICTGIRPNLSLLRIFGCRIFALPPNKRDSKLDIHARPGIFLGFQKSLRSAIYLDTETGVIKTARHVSFDEGMQDCTDPPPYVHFLKDADIDPNDHLVLGDEDALAAVPTPFNDVTEIDCQFSPDAEHPLGFQVGRDPRFLRAFATAFNRPFGKFDPATANKKFLGSFILKIGDYPVFSPDDIAVALDHYRRMKTPPSSLVVRLATDQRSTISDNRPPSLHLRPADIRRIAALGLVAGEGTPSEQRAAIRKMANAQLPSFTPPDPDDLVVPSAAEMLEMRKLANDHMTPEERELKSFTRKNLMKLPNWEEWQAADDLQLDTHLKSGTIGHPVPRPVKDPDIPSQVYRLHWARLVKSSGVRKSRACLDGSKRAAPWLRLLVQTYSSCVELPCLRLFIATAVNRGYYICFGDVENAYQQSPPPTIDCFLEVDDTIYDWYFRRFGVKLNKLKDVIPLYKALQGHPEAGVLWERMINDILLNKMGFKNTAHEKNLYVGTIDGKEVLVCRQVDDFASAAASKETAKKFITELRKYVETEYAELGIETDGGMFQRYNGIDVIQTRDYVKLGCESYLDRVLQSHGWDSPKHDVTNLDKVLPLNPTVAARLLDLTGPPEKTVEARALAKKVGFGFRNLLGELIYPYVLCRLDIGYAICFLARFSDAPHEEHYKALKGICKYLRATKSWGLIYWRPSPLMDLPLVSFDYAQEDPSLPNFPVLERDKLVGFLDAAHATTKDRRSVTGLVMMYGCTAVAWKSRVQPIVATSSTEAEFYAAVTCAKIAKYLRYVLQELDALAPGPTELFIDNRAALDMINESRPTPRARHIEIQHFAIQEWRQRGDIVMRHIAGILNLSDDLTKVLGWILHSRHARRSMGHYALDSSCFGSNSIAVRPSASTASTRAGEGVGAQFRGPHYGSPVVDGTIVTKEVTTEPGSP